MQAIKLNIVNPGSRADAAGLKQGDILISYNGAATGSESDLLEAIAHAKSGQEDIVIVFLRGTETFVAYTAPGPLGVIIGPEDIPDDLDLRTHGIVTKHSTTTADDLAVRSIAVTTAPSIEGRPVIRTIDVVSSEHVMGINIFGDFLSSLTDTFGGRSGTIQNAMRSARESAVHELRKMAQGLGANAIINIRINHQQFSGKNTSMVMLAAYGTAVVISEQPTPREPAQEPRHEES